MNTKTKVLFFVVIYSMRLFTNRIVKFTNKLVKLVFTMQVSEVTNLIS